MLKIDGSFGEGGGQVLRTALGLSLATGQPFEIAGIRAGRARPGLLRQHLAGVRLATALSGAAVDGASLGSTTLRFSPGRLREGAFAEAIGSAGSTLLVLQAVLPGLLAAPGPIAFDLEGGTHNPASPPFPFVEGAFLPRLREMGADVVATLHRPGFYPAGGGSLTVRCAPGALAPRSWVERGPARLGARAIVSGLPGGIGRRELQILQAELGVEDCALEEVVAPRGPGNALFVTVSGAWGAEVFTAFGEKGVRAEAVAHALVEEVRAYLAAEVPIGAHLADQLLIPLALAGGGDFRTVPLTEHTRTNAAIIERFLPVRFGFADEGATVRVSVR